MNVVEDQGLGREAFVFEVSQDRVEYGRTISKYGRSRCLDRAP
jgi:hypothetical protein